MAIVVFLLVFTIIVTLHEFGHYYVAKKSGVLVREFALGMGPKVFSWRKGETTFTLRALPLGGFVRMAGDGDDTQEIKQGQRVYLTQNEDGRIVEIDTQDKPSNTLALPVEVSYCDIVGTMTIKGFVAGESDEQIFVVDDKSMHIEHDGTRVQVAPLQTHLETKSAFKRIAIYAAGPINNFLLSIFVFTLLAFSAGGVNSPSNRVTVSENGVAARIGIQTGDKITAINDTAITNFSDLTTVMARLRQQHVTDIDVTYESNHQTKTIRAQLTDGYLGVTQSKDTDIWSKLTYGFTETIVVVKQVWLALVGLVTNGFNVGQLGGPIAIVQMSGEVAQSGILSIFSFLAILSANLGVINLLPIPGLDGGKILLALIELLRGKPLSKNKEVFVTMIGVGILLLLMVVVTFNDIAKLFIK
ncbi:site-2 protease family protein [Carnobacteriaceae bacterium zg-ZUI240]|nr:site-2 protease family protein [Carnobacteriaceae bacterium zg-ZUI240]